MSVRAYQPKIVEYFCNVLSEKRLNHAYLFSGHFGSFDMAILLAQTLFCPTPKEGLACGTCRSCQLIENQSFPDVRVIEPVGNVIKTDLTRQVVSEFSQSGFEGKKQVFIIRDSDKMHVNAANSLLKMIEEPSSDSHIFLLTEDEHKILPTIQSRCQLIRFPKDIAYLVNDLEQLGLLKSQARLLAQIAKDISEARQLATSSKILDLLTASQSFVKQWQKPIQQFYLESTRLSMLPVDKVEQELVFKMLAAIIGQNKTFATVKRLEDLECARKMWQANVSFQNALDYIVLSAS